MSITYNSEKRILMISGRNMTYAAAVIDGYWNNIYWGKRVTRMDDLPIEERNHNFCKSFVRLGKQREEYPVFGSRIYAPVCLKATFSDGVREVALKFVSCTVSDSGDTASVLLADEHYPLELELAYKLYEDIDLIDRHTVIKNMGDTPIMLENMGSAAFYPPYADNARLTYMGSSWMHEYEKQQCSIGRSYTLLEARSGLSNSRNFPYFAIDDGFSREDSGEVWFGSLQWSGNWQIYVGKDDMLQTRVSGGISPFDSAWCLRGGEEFTTPVFTVGYTDSGFGASARAFHNYIRKTSLAAQTNRVMPVLYNAWSSFTFNINEELLFAQAKRAADLGVELFLIDDGWFEGRKDDRAGLGDWYPDKDKFPHGLKPVAEYVNSLGMNFGLWVEPEMVCKNSNLYKEHPDWIMRYENRVNEEIRYQVTLNFAREDVIDFTIEWLDRLLGDINISCLKWDMNRWLSQCGWPEADEQDRRSMMIKYIHGLYKVFSYISKKYPNVMIENCASGGQRADLSMSKWCSRINRSDNQDPLDILKLHEGFTRVNLSKTAGGGCHLHHTPHGVNGRSVSLKYMANLAMMGSFAVGLDLRRLDSAQLEEVKGYIALYKEIRETVQLGDMYILASVYDNCYMAVEYVNRDKSEAVLFLHGHSMQFGYVFPRIKLKNLDSDAIYTVEGFNDMSGEGLMNIGIASDKHLTGDFDSRIIRIRKKQEV